LPQQAVGCSKKNPEIGDGAPLKFECIGRILIGLADFFVALAEKLIEYGYYLIEFANNFPENSEEAAS
jgi:hypothetical protein